ncbi:MAG: class I SAM-dependent methyltransferase [Phycisphaerae bacterium]|jgi:SAM-dependent methyltransferase
MSQACLSCYRDPSVHEAVSALIRRRSTNRADVRVVALAGFELGDRRSVLDLGCGFGFMTEAVVPRVAADAQVVGVDACPENEAAYLGRVTAAGREGRFVCRAVERVLDWPDRSVDLVVASYSLYFFPEILAEVARILRPEGLFVVLTHTVRSRQDLARFFGCAAADGGGVAQVDAFSAERGGAALEEHFADVERIDYGNSLAFAAADVSDLVTYLRFKLPVFVSGAAFGDELPEAMRGAIATVLAGGGRIVVDKSDAIFRCRRPRCP